LVNKRGILQNLAAYSPKRTLAIGIMNMV
jgi:hypothetical protein